MFQAAETQSGRAEEEVTITAMDNQRLIYHVVAATVNPDLTETKQVVSRNKTLVISNLTHPHCCIGI